MTYYIYDKITHEYLTFLEVEEYRPIPDYSTTIAPPTYTEFQIPVFNTSSSVWSLELDYRKKISVTGNIFGGKPYYNPEKYWWASPEYNIQIGDKPNNREWTKIDKPEIVIQVNTLQGQYDSLLKELQDSDYWSRRCYEYEKGIDTHITKEKYEYYLSELKRLSDLRPNLDTWQFQIDSLKLSIVAQYGEEALEHL